MRAEDADEFFGFVVVGREVIIGDGPIEALAVAAVGLEVIGTHAEGDAAIVIGAASQHAAAPPAEVTAGRGGVGLTFDCPTSGQSGVEIAEGLLFAGSAAMRGLIGPLKHLGLLGAIKPAAGFEHADLGSSERENVRGDAAAGSRANDHYVVCFVSHDVKRRSYRRRSQRRRSSGSFGLGIYK